ncbi:MAG: AsmA family protein [Pseudomonadota bacterium]|nr:AsmA family protein [Pseudomonadota bacterium]
MSKGLKIVARVLAAIVVLIVVSVAAVSIFFDPNDYKPEVSSWVKDKTGRELTIGGDIDLEFLPRLGVSAEQLALGNAEGFGPAPFATVERVQVRVELLPLIKKELQMDALSIHGLALSLIKDKAGKTNWDDLKRRQPKSGKDAGALTLGGLDIRNASLTMDDRGTGKLHTLERLNIGTGALAPKTDIDFDIDGTLSSAPLNARIEVRGVINPDPDSAYYQLRKLLAAAEIKGGNLPDSVDLKLAVDSATLQAEMLTIESFKLAGAGLVAEGELQGKVGDEPSASGTLKIAPFNPRDVMQRLGMKPPQTADAKVLSRAALSAEIDSSPDSLKMSDLTLQLDDSTLTGGIAVSNFSKPAATFALKVDSIDLDRYRAPEKKSAKPGKGSDMLPLDGLEGRNIRGTLRIGKLKVAGEQTTDFVIRVDTR